jgi:hypothetical protein
MGSLRSRMKIEKAGHKCTQKSEYGNYKTMHSKIIICMNYVDASLRHNAQRLAS